MCETLEVKKGYNPMGIRAIGANIAHKVASPFTRKSTSTNPFENNSFSGRVFKGSVLPFADVFQSNKVKEASKLKMMSASVVSAISNFGHKISQPIVNFAKNVKAGINNTIAAVKALPQKVNEIGKNFSQKISESLHIDKLHKEEAKDGVKILNMREINTKASIADLKSTWLEENKLELAKKTSKEAA